MASHHISTNRQNNIVLNSRKRYFELKLLQKSIRRKWRNTAQTCPSDKIVFPSWEFNFVWGQGRIVEKCKWLGHKNLTFKAPTLIIVQMSTSQFVQKQERLDLWISLFSTGQMGNIRPKQGEKPLTNLNCFGKPVGISLVHLLSGPISISKATLISISISKVPTWIVLGNLSE